MHLGTVIRVLEVVPAAVPAETTPQPVPQPEVPVAIPADQAVNTPSTW